jgi:serine/threonine-protein kinase
MVSDGSQQQIQMPDLTGMTQNQAQQKLGNLGWTGNFQVQTTTTFDPAKDGQIKQQNPNAGSQIDKNQQVFITVQQLIGGGTTTTTNGPGGF